MSLENIKIRYAIRYRDSGAIEFLYTTLMELESWREIVGDRNALIIGRDIYIGKDDKNWKEIYAGDIVELKNQEAYIGTSDHMCGIGVVKYISECLWFYAYRSPYNKMMLDWGGTESIEILGNRYEDPTLIPDL